MLPILVSVPHGGTETPPEIADRVIASPADIFDDGDACTREIYAFEAAVAHIHCADVARAFVDLNRAPDDLPPRSPDGVVKSETCYAKPIYAPGQDLTPELIDTLLDRHYHPYHRALTEAASDPLLRLAIDCHSMASKPPPISPDPGQERPLFCLSNAAGQTCPNETLERLADALVDTMDCARSDVWLNRPFRGGYITRAHGSGPLPWLQIEMNRSLYLADPWFDRPTLTVDPDRLSHLRDRLLEALELLDLG